ncbi:MAG: hypothetical protein ABF443_10615, partial [Acetobacter malorum]|uniref:hypothetical protein n=1 Tax=Acetobacter malorum TaxID=178901 RepID=UPI0039E83F52
MSKFKNRTDKKFLLKKVLNYIDDHLSNGYISYADADVLKEIEETNKSEKLCDDEIEILTGKLEDVNQKINNTIEKLKNDIFLS